MYFQKKYVLGEIRDVLIVDIVNSDDVNEITQQYATWPCIQIDLSSLHYLVLFQCITTLVLTGGITNLDGLACLYGQKNLKNLVLDFEETDSDIDGIQLEFFPSLTNVLSRSNLNIKNFNSAHNPGIDVKILNYYLNGKRVKGNYSPNFNIFQEPQFLFFSSESWAPAGHIIMSILTPVEKLFRAHYGSVCFSQQIDQLSIIPICVPQEMINEGVGKVRKNVSLKRRSADIRLRIPYQLFLNADFKTRQCLCVKNIEDAAYYVAQKDRSFELNEFIIAIKNVFTQAYSV